MVPRMRFPRNRDATTSGAGTSEAKDTTVALNPNDVAENKVSTRGHRTEHSLEPEQ
jgi:hypothetical protein